MRLDRPFHEHAGSAGVGRALDRGVEVGAGRAVVPPVMQAVSRILSRCPGSVSPPRSSIWSSVMSTATSIACSTRTSAPTPPAVISSRSPSSRSRAIPPRISCSARRSSRDCAESLEKFAARTGRTAAVVGFPEVQRDLANAAALCARRTCAGRVPQAPPPQLRGVRRAALLRGVDRRRPVVRRRRRARRRSPSARTPGARTGRSSRRPRAVPSSSSTSTRRRTTRGASTSATRCSRTRAADAVGSRAST